jgi:predicted RND superfamily exporter protein
MKRPLHWALDHPALVGTLVAIATLVFAIQIPRLEIDSSTENFMKEDDPARQYYEQFQQKFGSDTFTIVLVKADDVFAAPVLSVIQQLSDACARLDGVTRVESLTTLRNIKGEGDSLVTDPLVPAQIPADASELAQIRSDALGSRVMVGNIVAKDARASAIIVYTTAERGDKTFNTRFSSDVQALIDDAASPGVGIYQLGLPLIDATVGDFILKDLMTFVPLSLGVLFALLLLSFRTLQGMVIPFVTGVLSIVWALGLMALLGFPINVLTAAIPSLILVIGATEDVHVLSEYHLLLREGVSKLTAIRTTIERAALPILITTATTVFGFLSLVTSDLTMLIQFGYASALALTANFVVTVLVLPIMLRVWRMPKRFAHPDPEEVHGSTFARLIDRLGEFNLRNRIPIAVVSVLLVAASLGGWYSLRVNTEPLGFFPEQSFIRVRSSDLRQSLTGFSAFYVVVDSGRPDGIKDPGLMRRIADLQEFLLGSGEVDKTVSAADYVRKMHREMNGGNPAFEAVPDSAEQIAQYLLLLEGDELSQYVDFNASTATIVVRHHVAGSWELTALLERLGAYADEHFPEHVSVRETGQSILINNAADSMALNELVSLWTTFIVISIVHALFFASVRVGLLSMVPNVIPVLLNFGLMGALGIPLNPGTAMIATIALGIAVDDTVHHVVTYWRQLREHRDRRVAMFNTMRAQGRPIIRISLALAGGFLILAFSQFVPIRQFGVLSAVVMVVAMVSELVLTPIVMYSASSYLVSRRKEVFYETVQGTPGACS